MGLKDITSQQFGKLKVISRVENDWLNNARWLCECDCGNEIIVLGYALRNKNTRSCGCLGRKSRINANTKHNLSDHRLHLIWDNMKQRCYNQKSPNFKYYGGRGIKICDEWLNNFINFYNWSMNNKYAENLSIDRIDNDGNYEPSNCRWVTMKEQCNNKRQRTKRSDIDAEKRI